jgi:hypothetical protein
LQLGQAKLLAIRCHKVVPTSQFSWGEPARDIESKVGSAQAPRRPPRRARRPGTYANEKSLAQPGARSGVEGFYRLGRPTGAHGRARTADVAEAPGSVQLGRIRARSGGCSRAGRSGWPRSPRAQLARSRRLAGRARRPRLPKREWPPVRCCFCSGDAERMTGSAMPTRRSRRDHRPNQRRNYARRVLRLVSLIPRRFPVSQAWKTSVMISRT